MGKREFVIFDFKMGFGWIFNIAETLVFAAQSLSSIVNARNAVRFRDILSREFNHATWPNKVTEKLTIAIETMMEK